MSKFIRVHMEGLELYLKVGNIVGLEEALVGDKRSVARILFAFGAFNTSRLVDETPEEVARLLGWTPPPDPALKFGPPSEAQRRCGAQLSEEAFPRSPAVDGYGVDETGADYAARAAILLEGSADA